MPQLSIDNTTTVTNVNGQTLNVAAFSGFNLSVVTIAGPQGIPGPAGTGGGGGGSAGVSSLNSLTGTINLLTSGNNLYIRPVGNDIYIDTTGTSITNLSGYITTGQADLRYYPLFTNPSLFVPSGDLTNTGVAIENQLNSLSGFTTGVSGYLQSRINAISTEVVTINSLSGAINILGSGIVSVIVSGQNIIVSGDTSILSGSLAATGATLITRDSNISGAIAILLTATGQTLYGNILATSGSLQATGQNLYSYITITSGFATGASGSLATSLTSTGLQIGVISGALDNRLTNTGVQLITSLNALSGNLTTTGTLLSAIKVSGSSIVPVGDFSGLGNIAVIYSGGKIFISGSSSASSNADALNISGSLTQTGVQIENQLNSLSGWTSNASGALQAQIAANSAGVSTLNALSGALNIIGTGMITVSTGVGKIYISGDTSISGALTSTGLQIGAISGALATLLTLTGQTLYGNNVAVSGSLASSGSNLYNFITQTSGMATGASGYFFSALSATGHTLYLNDVATSGSLANTGQTLYGNVTAVSGSLATTGQTLYNYVLGTSGSLQSTGLNLQTQINSLSGFAAPALANYVYTTGSQFITGPKIFTNVLGINSGLTTACHYVGLANYTFGSGDYIVVFTGSSINVTGILPSINNYSGNLFTVINNTTGPIQISGIIASDTNPTLYQYESIEIYGASGVWAYLGKQTGNLATITYANNISGAIATQLTNTGLAIGSISGALAILLTSTGQTLLNNIISTSGSLASTGQSLYNYITQTSGFATGSSGYFFTNLTQTGLQIGNISGALGTLLTISGQTLYNNIVATSGSLSSTGLALYNYVTQTSGFATGASGYFFNNLTQTGLQIGVISGALNSRLTTTGTLLSAVQITGSTTINVANFTGLGGTLIIYSGSQIFVSGAAAAAGGGSNIQVTGSANIASASLTGIGGTLVLWSGNQIFISGGAGVGGGVPSVNSITSAVTIAGTGNISVSTAGQNIFISGDNSISGALTSTGLQIGIISGALATLLTLSGQTLYNNDVAVSGSLATTGTTLYNIITAASGQANINYAPATAQYIYTTGNQSVGGLKTWGSGAFTGWINIGNATVLPDNPIAISGSGIYLQVAIQNNSTAISGSSDYIATTNLGNDSTGYIDLGINNSNYNDPLYSIMGANDGYVLINGGDLLFGTLTTGKFVQIFTDGSLTGNLRANFDSSGLNIIGSGDIRINNSSLTKNLISTGQQIGNISGALASLLTITGQTLYNNIIATSGSLANSGLALYNYITATSGFATGSSGYFFTNLTQTGLQIGNISGALATLLTLSGVTLNNNNIANGTNLSGNLGTTGRLLSAITITGSNIVNSGNFLPLGNMLLIYSGNSVFISGNSAGTGAGVSALNSLQNSITIIGTGGLFASTIGQQVVISGANGLQGLNFSGVATNPIPTMFASGWGNSLLMPALHSRRIKGIFPQLTTTQQVWGDTAANVGTLTTEASELYGENTRITPAAGLSAGTSYTTATIYRGSQVGINNGFFFVSKFSLTGNAINSTNARGGYGTSGTRFFCGLTDQAVATQVQLNDPIGNFVGLQYLWASGGSVGTGQYMQNFAVTSRNNVSTSTGNIAMNFQTGFYRFAMFCPPFPNNNIIYYEIDDLVRNSGTAGTITSTLPVGSTAMRALVAVGFVSGLWPLGVASVYTEIPTTLNGGG